MIIWKHTFSELVNETEEGIPGSLDPPFQVNFDPDTIVPITEFPEFATARIEGDGKFENQVLLKREGDQWRSVGSFDGGMIVLEKGERGRGLAVELLLRCAEHRDPPLSKFFTPAGFALVRRAHGLAVCRALKAGLDVPPEVLADCPGLVKAKERGC